MNEQSEFWTQPGVRQLEAQFYRREPNVDSVRLTPGALAQALPQGVPFGLVVIVQGRYAYGHPLFYN